MAKPKMMKVTKEEVGLAFVLVSQLDPDKYKPTAKAVILKAKAMVEDDYDGFRF